MAGKFDLVTKRELLEPYIGQISETEQQRWERVQHIRNVLHASEQKLLEEPRWRTICGWRAPAYLWELMIGWSLTPHCPRCGAHLHVMMDGGVQYFWCDCCYQYATEW